MKHLITPHLSQELGREGFPELAAKTWIDVDDAAFNKWSPIIDEHHANATEEERHALKIIFCLTHPDHQSSELPESGSVAKEQKFLYEVPHVDVSFPALVRELKLLRITIILLIALVYLIFAATHAHAQYDATAWHGTFLCQNNDGSQSCAFSNPFILKAGSNCSMSASGIIVTMNCSGGAAAAGGSNGQVQWNNATALGGISTLTTDGTVVTQKAGTNYLIVDPVDTSKKFRFDVSNLTTATTRIVNIPDANSTTVQPDTGAANNFISAISAQGVISKGRPACADLSDSSGGCSMSTTAGGDLSGTLPSPTVAKVNGVAYPASPSTDTVPVITAANVVTYEPVSDCQDVGGNHVNYTVSTHQWSCGTTSTGGSSKIVSWQKSAAAVTAVTSTDTVIYSVSIPSGTIGAGQGIRVTAYAQHTTGTATANYKINFGATSVTIAISNASTTVLIMTALILNNPGSTTGQQVIADGLTTGTTKALGSTINTAAENTNSGSPITLSFVFNIANNTDQVTPKAFLVELIN